jgi:hypothetical protein
MTAFNDVTPAELAAAASALSDPSRAAIIITLLDGRVRTAGELAAVAVIAAADRQHSIGGEGSR